MTDQQKLKAAAKRRKIGDSAYDYFHHYDEYYMPEQKFDDAQILADAYLADLAAREAAEAERALPVDAEWLDANLPMVCFYRLPHPGESVAVYSFKTGYSLRRYQREDKTCYWSLWNDRGDSGIRLPDSLTRGGVLDLRMALGVRE